VVEPYVDPSFRGTESEAWPRIGSDDLSILGDIRIHSRELAADQALTALDRRRRTSPRFDWTVEAIEATPSMSQSLV
jgi:hypothetical protein